MLVLSLKLFGSQRLHGFNRGGAAGGQGRGQHDHYRGKNHRSCEREWVEGGDAVQLAAEEAGKRNNRGECDKRGNGRDDGHLAHHQVVTPYSWLRKRRASATTEGSATSVAM